MGPPDFFYKKQGSKWCLLVQSIGLKVKLTYFSGDFHSYFGLSNTTMHFGGIQGGYFRA